MELGVGDGVLGDLTPLDDFQRGLDRIEEGHRAGLAGAEGNLLGNIAEDYIGGYIDFRDFIAAHGDVFKEDAALAVRGSGGAVTAVDLLDFVGHMGNGIACSNVLLQNLKAGLLVVGESRLHRPSSGQQGDVLMGAGLDVGFFHRLLGNAVDAGLEVGQCLFSIHGNSSGVAARKRFHQEGGLDLGKGLGVCLGDFQAGQRAVAGGNGVLLIAIGHIHIDAVGRRVQGIAIRSLYLHKRPQALGYIVDCDDAATGGHIAAHDLAVSVDIVEGTIQATGSPGNHLLKRDVAVTGNGGRRIVAAFRLIVRYHFAGCVIGEEALAAGYAGDCKNGPLAGRILHDRRLLTLGGVLFHLGLKFGILIGLLTQHPVVIAHIGLIGIRVGKAASINIAGGIAACGFVALVVPDVGLQGHEQTAGDLAGIVRNIGHHPFDVFLGDGVHLAQSCLGDCFLPQGVGVRAGGAGVGVAI